MYLERIGIVCPDCQTEAIFDLGDKSANPPRNCPGCDKELLPQFPTGSRETEWRREIAKNGAVRLYFRHQKRDNWRAKSKNCADSTKEG